MGRLDRSEFMHLAPDTPGTVRFNHDDCPAGVDTKRRLYITRKEDYNVVAYCHNCSLGGCGGSTRKYRTRNVPVPLVDSKERLSLMGENYEDDFEKWPGEMVIWLAKGGISLTTATKYGIVYDAESKRICIPKFDEDGELVQFQSRRLFDDGSPKYLTYKEKDKYLHDPVWREHICSDYKTCIIVEDMISAIRCAELGYFAVPLFTSTMTDETYLRVVNKYDIIVVWLDNDNPIVVAHASAIERKLKSMTKGNRLVDRVYNIPEPKRHSDSLIEEVIESITDDYTRRL